MKDINGEEYIKICDNYKECDFIYGGAIYEIGEKDFNLLRSGKLINFSVNEEYGCVLKYTDKESNNG